MKNLNFTMVFICIIFFSKFLIAQDPTLRTNDKYFNIHFTSSVFMESPLSSVYFGIGTDESLKISPDLSVGLTFEKRFRNDWFQEIGLTNLHFSRVNSSFTEATNSHTPNFPRNGEIIKLYGFGARIELGKYFSLKQNSKFQLGLGIGAQYAFNRINFSPTKVYTLLTSRNESFVALQHSGIAKYQINDFIAVEFKTTLNTGSIRFSRNTIEFRNLDENEVENHTAFGFGDLWYFRFGAKMRI